MEVRDVVNEQINLDQTLTGTLNHAPFRSWSDTVAPINSVGGGSSETVTLANFDVEYDTGIISYNRFVTGGNWPRQYEMSDSPYAEAISPYHRKSLNQIDNNTQPYQMTASYRAGVFSIVSIAGSGMPSGSTDVIVTSVDDLKVGQEFYFSEDPTNEPSVNQRFITAIDTTLNQVTFTPSVGYALTTSMKLRQIDFAVRMAVGLIIQDLITFPPNTHKFNKGLGRFALVKQWERTARRSIPPAAMELIASYMR